MLSAHGSAPEVVESARARDGVVVDAVCPLVTKVHHELKVRSRKGYTVLYVGHAGHEEAVGTMAVAPESVRLLEHEEDLDALADLDPAEAPVALLAQTTLSHDEWRGLMEAARQRFPDLWMPNRSDLCFATTNRQAALKAIAAEADAVVVIGSANSSNTVALEKVARAGGCPRVLRVNEADELPDDLTGTVGVTAGASAPEALVEEVIARLAPAQGVTEVDRHRPRTSTSRRPPSSASSCVPWARRWPFWPAAPVRTEPIRRPRTGPCPPRTSSTCWPPDPSKGDNCAMTFTRMDQSTAEQWQHIIVESIEHQPRVAERVLGHAGLPRGDHRRLRGRPAGPLAADGDPGRGSRAPATRSSSRRCATTSARPSR